MKKEDKQFVYYWYREFDWKSNPFERKFIEPISKFIAGYEKERRKLNYFVIDKLPLAIISGKDGLGKSTLLLWLKEELGKYKEVVIVDYINKDVDFIKFLKILLEPFLTVKEKLAGFGSKVSSKSLDLIKDKNLFSIYEALYFRRGELDLGKIRDFVHSRLNGKPLVLLVDDYDSLDEKLTSLFKVLLESEIEVQVAIATKENIERLGKKNAVKIPLSGLSFNECKDMAGKRILSVGGNGLSPFDNNLLSVLYKKCSSSPFVFLELCKDKAVGLALVNLGVKKEEKVVEEKKEEVKQPAGEVVSEKKEEVNVHDKAYEIKVVNPQPTKMYNIKVVQQGTDRTKAKKLKKDKVKTNRVR